MGRLRLHGFTALFTASCLIAATLFQSLASAQTREYEPGEGVICALAIYSVVTEVGRRCHPAEDVEVQEELARTILRLDAFVLANTNGQVTQQQIDEFKRQQGHFGASEEFLCHGDADQMYRAVVAQGADELRQAVDGLVSRPGEPTWGTCL